MKILVTGGAGFIASQIADAYIADGHEVVIVDDLSTGHRVNVNPKAQLVLMDVRDPNISTLFGKMQFDVVNHHAAQIDVRKSVHDPFFDASVNILGTLRLLECCRAYNVGKFIFSSSGGTYYGECPTKAGEEGDPSQPTSPYGFSKATAETYIKFYGLTYHLPYTILRYGNVYGPRQDPHGEAGVIAIFIGKFLSGETVTIYGTGKQERDYVFVGDVVEANRAALAKGNNKIFNIGTGTPVSVLMIHKTLSTLQPKAAAPIFAAPRAGELERSLLNPALALKELGWKAQNTFAQGLEKTYRHFEQLAKTSPKKS